MSVETLKLADGKTIKANKFGAEASDDEKLELTDEEKKLVPELQVC